MNAQASTTALPRRVLVTGATGFIGSRLCEVLALIGLVSPRAFVHSTASAARIMRFDLDFAIGDLCDRASVARALDGCDAVVHLARGDRSVMRTGLENVLRASAAQRVSRFVHVSSVAVYGNSPPPESTSETAPARPGNMAYGVEKLGQERRVLRYGQRGLPIVILRPPNVWGPFAHFTVDLLGMIRAGRMALVNGGTNPCNLVYVDNLVNAVLLALWRPEAVGEIFFVTDADVASWEQCVYDHAALVGAEVPHVADTELIPRRHKRVVRDSLRVLPRVLLGSDLRIALRQIPALQGVENALYARFQALPEETKQRLRLLVNGPTVLPMNSADERRFSAETPLIAAQSRTVAHSSDKARHLLGYAAPVSYAEGLELTRGWLEYVRLVERTP